MGGFRDTLLRSGLLGHQFGEPSAPQNEASLELATNGEACALARGRSQPSPLSMRVWTACWWWSGN